MSRTDQPQIRCTVEGAQNLPAELGGPDAVCGTIIAAAAPALKNSGIAPSQVTVTVKVKSAYLISAVASAGTGTIPEQNVGIADRTLNGRAIEMLAQGVAVQLAKLGRQAPGDN